MKFVSAGENGTYQPETRTVVWAVPAVPAGQGRVLTYRAMPVAAGPLLSQAGARSDQGHDTTLFSLVHAVAPDVTPVRTRGL
jgi:hypothetical protein